MQEPDAPILLNGKVDVTIVRQDGTVHMQITVAGRLSESVEHQRLLLDKIEDYLCQRNSPGFMAEFKDPPAVIIDVVFHAPPSPVIEELLRRSIPWAAEYNCKLDVTYLLNPERN